jgi:hypothetical protein
MLVIRIREPRSVYVFRVLREREDLLGAGGPISPCLNIPLANNSDNPSFLPLSGWSAMKTSPANQPRHLRLHKALSAMAHWVVAPSSPPPTAPLYYQQTMSQPSSVRASSHGNDMKRSSQRCTNRVVVVKLSRLTRPECPAPTTKITTACRVLGSDTARRSRLSGGPSSSGLCSLLTSWYELHPSGLPFCH